jgi:uncharacterized protein (TIGR02145 family)
MKKGTFTDLRDGKVYRTIVIGNQTWMAENLCYNASGSKCYNNNTANCQKYGRLYNWNTALTTCPKGWHLPSRKEWQILDDFVGGEKIAGKKLRAKSGWNDYNGSSGNGTDDYGFSALPGGNGFSKDRFRYVGDNGSWWSASVSERFPDSSHAYGRNIGYGDKDVKWNDIDKNVLISVRCVQD